MHYNEWDFHVLAKMNTDVIGDYTFIPVGRYALVQPNSHCLVLSSSSLQSSVLKWMLLYD